MRVLQAAALVSLSTALITTAILSFVLFPRGLTASLQSPTFFMQAVAVAGAVIAYLATRNLRAIDKSLSDASLPHAHSAG